MHPTGFCYRGEADPSAPGGIAAAYRDLLADAARTAQVAGDVAGAGGRRCLVLTKWVAHVERLADVLRSLGHDPVTLRGGMGARARAATLARLQPGPGGPPLLVVATGSCIGEGFDRPVLDTLFPAAPDLFHVSPADRRKEMREPILRMRASAPMADGGRSAASAVAIGVRWSDVDRGGV